MSLVNSFIAILPATFFLTAAMATNGFAGEEKSLISGPEQVALVEVYTSEGCSSCPPADSWLSKRKTDRDLFKRYVPLGMHVDYWNKLGWDDRMSAPIISQRQRAIARTWSTPSVYTPAVIYNGDEYKWRRGLRHEKTVKVGVLKVSRKGAKYAVLWRPEGNFGNQFDVTGSVFMQGVETKVTRGENSGRTLKHDFAACGLRTVALTATKAGFSAVLDLPTCAEEKVEQRGVAFFVSQKNSPRPLQAVGGYLD